MLCGVDKQGTGIYTADGLSKLCDAIFPLFRSSRRRRAFKFDSSFFPRPFVVSRKNLQVIARASRSFSNSASRAANSGSSSRVPPDAVVPPFTDLRSVQTLVDGDEETEKELGITLNEVYERLEELDSDNAEARAAQLLSGLGFDGDMQGKPTREYSGGWRLSGTG